MSGEKTTGRFLRFSSFVLLWGPESGGGVGDTAYITRSSGWKAVGFLTFFNFGSLLQFLGSWVITCKTWENRWKTERESCLFPLFGMDSCAMSLPWFWLLEGASYLFDLGICQVTCFPNRWLLCLKLFKYYPKYPKISQNVLVEQNITKHNLICFVWS